LTLKVVDELASGTATPVAQDDRLASHVGKLSKDDGWIPWEKSCEEVERHIRAMQPWPGPFTVLHPTNRSPVRLKILDAVPRAGEVSSPVGTVVDVCAESFSVQCGEGVLAVTRLQPDGKRPMTAAEFLRGHLVRAGDRFETAV
jgi:methionyl-tRNA formyltransferase